ncbi:MAG: DUF4437 domain-containing protein [Bacteroidota bacterium]
MKTIRITAWTLVIVGILNSCTRSTKDVNQDPNNKIVSPTNKVLLSSEIEWEKLNPARGDKSPQAGTIWGDRKGSATTGFLAKFVDGFSSPPHIHNVTYRAVVIKGLVHNDDPNAENMWMKPGSFWTQPAGEIHITSAKGKENIALVEINKGPYLVKPTDEAFDNGERPINIDVSNIVWLDHQKSNWVDPGSKAEISILLESKSNTNLKSLFVKIPAKYNGEIKTDGRMMHAVIIKGAVNYVLPQNNKTKTLDTGSYFGSEDQAIHTISNIAEGEVVIYIRTNGSINVG